MKILSNINNFIKNNFLNNLKKRTYTTNQIAFVSDIHSNRYAFKTVLRFLETKNVDQIYIAGDLLGYYYNAADVVDLCMTRKDIFCIRGNHDRNFLAALSDDAVMERFTVKYGSSFKSP